MVIYNTQARRDLANILKGLISWKKHPLEYVHALQYVDDITDACDNLDDRTYHFDATYDEHLQYGDKVFTYKRNPHTTWYVIYDVDNYRNVYINKIVSNYLTKS
jgi:hypothetical protein